jgi:hypothetical protein
MGDILKEAIADAKAVRETALANAKMALEEAFTPQLQSMLSAKLREDDDEFEGEEEFGGEEEVPAEEAYEEDEEFSDEVPAEEGSYYEDEEVPAEDMEIEPEVEEVIEINGVKYAPVVQEDEMSMDDEVPAEHGEGELDLESIIKELEDELSEGEDEEETVDEQDDSYDDKASSADKNDGKSSSTLAEEDDAYDESPNSSKKNEGNGDLMEGDDEDEVEIDESLFFEGDEDEEELDEVDKPSGIGNGDNSVADTDKSSGVGSGDNKLSEVQAELKEYKAAVHFLKDKLHEVNILNAKLLFTNKLFKEFSLDNNQKLKVVETFDRTQSTREIKLVYSTLAEQFSDNGSITRKHSITESASSRVGSTKPSKESRKVISEEANVANRFKKLAGIIK